jgi:hypothetical protein
MFFCGCFSSQTPHQSTRCSQLPLPTHPRAYTHIRTLSQRGAQQKGSPRPRARSAPEPSPGQPWTSHRTHLGTKRGIRGEHTSHTHTQAHVHSVPSEAAPERGSLLPAGLALPSGAVRTASNAAPPGGSRARRSGPGQHRLCAWVAPRSWGDFSVCSPASGPALPHLRGAHQPAAGARSGAVRWALRLLWGSRQPAPARMALGLAAARDAASVPRVAPASVFVSRPAPPRHGIGGCGQRGSETRRQRSGLGFSIAALPGRADWRGAQRRLRAPRRRRGRARGAARGARRGWGCGAAPGCSRRQRGWGTARAPGRRRPFGPVAAAAPERAG